MAMHFQAGFCLKCVALVTVVVADRSDVDEVGLGVSTRGSFKTMPQEAGPHGGNDTEIQRLRRHVEELEENYELRKKLEKAESDLHSLKTPAAPQPKPAKPREVAKKEAKKPAPPHPPKQPTNSEIRKVMNELVNPFGNSEDSLLEKTLEVAKLAEDPDDPNIDYNARLREKLLDKGYMTRGKETINEVEAAEKEERKRARKEALRGHFQYKDAFSPPTLRPAAHPKPKEPHANSAYRDFMLKVQREDLSNVTALLETASKEVHTHHPNATRRDDFFQPFGEPEAEDDESHHRRSIDRVALAKNLAAQRKEMHDRTIHQVEEHLAKQQREEEDRVARDIEERAEQLANQDQHIAREDAHGHAAGVRKDALQAAVPSESQADKEKHEANAAENVSPPVIKKVSPEPQRATSSTSKDVEHMARQKINEKDDGGSMFEDIPESSWEFSRPGSEKISRADRVALSMFADDKDPRHPRLPPDSVGTRTEKATEHAMDQQQQPEKLIRQKQTEAKLSAQQAEIEKLQAQIVAMQAKSAKAAGEDNSDPNETREHALSPEVIMQAS